LSDFIKINRLDFVGIQETKRMDFSESTVDNYYSRMCWKCLSANGSAGGILVGFKSHGFEVVAWQVFEYCTVAIVKNQGDKFTWRLIVVYESPYEETKMDFVGELHRVMGLWQGPIVIGGGGTLTWFELLGKKVMVI
jgi:hypothetical protein